MPKRIIALLFVLLLLSPSFAALKVLETVKEENIVKIGENLVVPEGMEITTAVAVGGSVKVAGKVKEDVVAIGGNITLQKTAIVGGNVVAIGGTIAKNPDAVVRGEMSEVKLPAAAITKGLTWGLAVFSILSFVAFLIFALIIAALFGKQLGIVSYSIERSPWRALLWGLIVSALIVPLLLLMVLSIIGIFFIPVFILVLAAACLFGYIAASQLIGKIIIKTIRIYNKPMAYEVAAGIVLLFLLGFLPLLGGIIQLLLGIMGLGAIALTRFGTQG